MGKNKHTKKNTITRTNTRYQALYMIPILLLALVYPFLAQYNSVPNPLLGNPTYYQTATLADIFLYVKSQFLIFITITAIVIVGFDLYINKHSHSAILTNYRKFIPLVLYAVFIVLSTLFSANKTLALNGLPGQFENMWILLSYLCLCLFGYWYINNVENKSTLLYLLLGGTLLMGLVCLLQFLGADPYIAMFASKNATIAVSGVYGGFYNPNYLGSYVNLILPLLICLLIAFRSNKKMAILLGTATALTILGLIGSKTTGGIIGILLLSGFTILFLLFKKLHLSTTKFLVALGILSALGIGLLTAHLSKAATTDLYLYEPLHAIYTNDNNLEIHRGSYVFYIRTEHTPTNFYVKCTDENGHEIPTVVKDNTFCFEDEKYELFSIRPFVLQELENIVAFELKYGVTSWLFTNDYQDGTYYYITPAGGFTKTTPENTSLGYVFTDTPKFMSGRGYIWSQSIPMLSDTLLLGYGPDNYAEHFPNHNFVAALRGGFASTFISKPHSMYLQMAIQTGLPSLLAFLIFYLIYFVKSIRLYLTISLNDKHSFIGFGIFLGTIGYLLLGLINDSSITVAPFFWLLIGMGCAMNQICSDK